MLCDCFFRSFVNVIACWVCLLSSYFLRRQHRQKRKDKDITIIPSFIWLFRWMIILNVVHNHNPEPATDKIWEVRWLFLTMTHRMLTVVTNSWKTVLFRALESCGIAACVDWTGISSFRAFNRRSLVVQTTYILLFFCFVWYDNATNQTWAYDQ